MTIERIEVWCCDAGSCPGRAPVGTSGWFATPYAHGCPEHAELVEQHEPRLNYDTRGHGRLETTTVSLRCSCGWVPSTRWTQGSTEPLIREYLAHMREVSRPGPPDPEEQA